MAGLTEEEAHYWDKYYTENPPKPGPNGSGFFSQRKAALSIMVDSPTADYLTAKAIVENNRIHQIKRQKCSREGVFCQCLPFDYSKFII